MYYEHFGLTEPPFRITPDTRLFFAGGNRGAILDALAFAITNGEGIVKVVGEVGSGKTMLCRMLEVRLPDSVEVVYLANPNLSPENILHAIAFELQLGLAEDASRLQVMQSLQRYLLERHAAGHQVVVFVEEAQSMPLETLEEIRLLSNLETQRYKLLQLVLFGQPELEPNLSAPHIRQLRERITHSFELPPFSREEIAQYLDFRMRGAGYRGPDVFTPAAVATIARASHGLIRRVNILADKSLLAAYAAGTHQVTPKLVKVAVRDSEFGRSGGRWTRPLAWSSIAAGVVVLGGAIYLWLHNPQWPERGPTVAGGAGAAVPATADRLARAEPGAEGAADPEPEPDPDPEPAVEAGSANAPVPAAGGDDGPTVRGPLAASISPPLADGEPRAAAAGPAAPGTSAATAAPSVTPAETAPPPPEDGAVVAGALSPSLSEPPVLEAPAAGGAYLERRLAATREWLEQADPTHFSIQLMLVSSRRAEELDASLRDAGLGERLDDIYVYRASIDGEDVVGVLLGDYDRLGAARADLEALPRRMQVARPFIRNVRDIRLGRVRQVRGEASEG